MSKVYYVGLDVHLWHWNVCILDERGNRVKQMKLLGTWKENAESLRELEGEVQVCYEASCGYGFVYDTLAKVATHVAVAHPGHLRLIFQSKRKNDRIDAEKLAKLLFLGEVPGVYVPCKAVRQWRQFIKHRERMVAKRTRVKNSLRALLRSQGIVAPRKLWTQRGMAWLRSLKMTPVHTVQRDMLLEELGMYERQIQSAEEVLAAYAADHPGVEMVRTIPGVGIRTAEAVVAHIDDPRRFKNSKTIGSYFGLVPRQDQSGSKNRLGHITCEGPPSVRRLLTEAAWQGIRRSPTIRAYYERILENTKDRKKIALLATAHYLARVSFAILRHGEVWQETAAA